MAVPNPKKYTADEFFAFTPENNHQAYELYKGEIIALASPSIVHQRISGRLYRKIGNFIDSRNGKCEVFSAPTDVKLSDDNVVVPDIFVACNPDNFDNQKYNGSPDWIIEIVSSNRDSDFVYKLSLYMQYGVREYWIVDPKFERTVVYFFEKNEYPQIYTFDVPIPVNIYNGELAINIGELIK